MALHRLSTADARRMGAGQVLGDVVAIVKELLENALDAKATRVDVIVENYGIKSICVVDNGSGIPSDALPLVGQKDHTSKVSAISSLLKLTTYGFRGGAMHAIGVAAKKVTVQSAVAGGHWMEITLGADPQLVQTALVPAKFLTESDPLAQGTRVEVFGPLDRHPVRKNQQEGRTDEIAVQLHQLFISYALARPAVHLSAYFREPSKACFSRASQNDVFTTVRPLRHPDLYYWLRSNTVSVARVWHGLMLRPRCRCSGDRKCTWRWSRSLSATSLSDLLPSSSCRHLLKPNRLCDLNLIGCTSSSTRAPWTCPL